MISCPAEGELEINKLTPLIKRDAKTASIRLVRGPARDTSARSFLPSFRLNGSTGTGLAAPNTTGDPENIRKKGRIMLMNGSICFLGSSVRRPASRAVGSPSFSATNPCATSCRIAEATRMASDRSGISKSIK